MLKNLLNLKGAQVLKKEHLKAINGSGQENSPCWLFNIQGIQAPNGECIIPPCWQRPFDFDCQF